MGLGFQTGTPCYNRLMKTEYEAKFLDIAIDNVRELLLQAGAKLEKPMRLMRRVTIENEDLVAKNAFVRVRDEGDRTTITYKQFDELSVDGAKEYEITVSSFDDATALLGAAGLPHQSFQESKRETWVCGDVEIVIDEWPWLKPYFEIESSSEKQVRDFAEKLGYRWSDAVFGDVMAAYRAEYPHLSPTDTIGRVAEVRFGDPLPGLLRN